jgi:sulfide:quinone oxidoreductase
VQTPFSGRAPARHAIAELLAHCGAAVVVDRLAEVGPARHEVVLASGEIRRYDALVLALGARSVPAYPEAITFHPRHPEAVRELVGELERGAASRLAIVVPPGHHWTLPAYELALLIADRVRAVGRADVEILLAVPERAPLAVFGPEVAGAVERLLAEAGVDVRTGTFAELQGGPPLVLVAHPGGARHVVDRVVALPRLEPIQVPGLGAGLDGFLSVDGFGRVYGVPDVYAVGDMSRHPIKQGGLAAQQARAAAEHLAARFGAPVRPAPYTPVLRGRLRMPDGDRWIQDDPEHPGAARVADHPLWWPPGKLAGGELAAALARQAGAATA